MFGFRFPENFNHPYRAVDHRLLAALAHVAVDLVPRLPVHPAGRQSRRRCACYLNLLTVFFLCGLWHGASWTFVVWGLFHGLFLVAERVGGRLGVPPFPWPLRHAYVVVVVMVGWVLFRTETLAGATSFLAAMFGLGAASRLIRGFPSTIFSGYPWQLPSRRRYLLSRN